MTERRGQEAPTPSGRIFSLSNNGQVPMSPGGSTKFLREDGNWIVPAGGGGGSGTVTSVTVTTANGVSGSVTTPSTTPTITLTLGAITPSSVAAVGTVTGSNLSGTNTGNQTITLTGDVTGSGAGSFAATLATVNANTGTFGGAATVPQISVNGKGLITGVTAVTIAIPQSAVTNLTTDLSNKQPLDQQLTDIAALAYAGNAGKVIKVNAGATAFELATDATGSGGGVDFSTLPAASAVVDANEFLINEAGTQKKVTGSQIESYISTGIAGNSGAAGQRQTTLCLTANSADVTVLTQTTVMTITAVGAGTWRLKGTLIYQAAATTTGIGITVNHTGTVSRFVSNWIQLTTGGAAATGIGDQATATAGGQLVEGKAERVKDTRSSFTVGVDTANADELVVLDAIIIVTATGQLELKIATEITGSAVRLMAGSLLELSKVA